MARPTGTTAELTIPPNTGSSTMSDDPPQTRFERKSRIREWAYHIWKAAGRPDGYDKEHWEQAEALIAVASNEGRRC
jgi:hypothetical protein